MYSLKESGVQTVKAEPRDEREASRCGTTSETAMRSSSVVTPLREAVVRRSPRAARIRRISTSRTWVIIFLE